MKDVCRTLIEEGAINPFEDIEIMLMFDQDSALSDGYYNIEESIEVEFQRGIHKQQYGVNFKAIFYGEVHVKRQFCDSKIVDLIQASDFVAGSVRRSILHHDIAFLQHVKNKLYLP